MSRLAIDGGGPVRTVPFPPRITLDETELDAVTGLIKRCIAGEATLNRYGGTQVDEFEREFAAYYGAKYATGLSSGTGAIHAALGALDLDAGSEIISSPITDAGAVMPILLQQCIPVFADADAETLNLDPESLRERITARTRAVICGHLAGQPCDMDRIMEIAQEYGLIVIEDCSQAHAALYRGRQAGSIGHMAVFSLMSDKHITAGGQAGMLITNNEDYYWNAKQFADRGKSLNSPEQRNIMLGLNYRMTELDAVIGRCQLTKLPQFVARRRTYVDQVHEHIAALESVRPYKVIEGAESSWWFGLLRVDDERLTVSTHQFGRAVREEGVPCGNSYNSIIADEPVIRERRTFGRSGIPWTCAPHSREPREPRLPNARRAFDTHIAFRVHECLTESEARDFAAALAKVEAEYLR
jgi:perosamine synthetase